MTKRASKALGEYSRETRTVAALRRYEAHGIERHPGESVQYVVTEDAADGRRRVRLPFEAGASDYDADRLVRAARTVLAPFGWTRDRVERELRATRDLDSASF